MHFTTMKAGRHREDREKNVLKGHSFFVRFMERHELGDCIKYFPDTMTLGDLRCLTTYDLISRYDLKDPKDCERILKVVLVSFKEDQSDSELESGSSPKQQMCQLSSLSACHKEVSLGTSQLMGRTLSRTVSEDIKFQMKARNKFSLTHSPNASNYFSSGFRHFSSQYGLNQVSSGSSVSNESGNLLRLNVLGLGKSAPSLSTCHKEQVHFGLSASSAARQFSSRISFRNQHLALTSSSLSLAHQVSSTPVIPGSPVDSPRTTNVPMTQNFQFLLGKNHSLVDSRRWSVASLASSSGSGNNSPACPSNPSNLFSSQDRLFGQQPPLRHHNHPLHLHHHHHHHHHHFNHHQHHSLSEQRHHHHHQQQRHFSSSDSNPTSLHEGCNNNNNSSSSSSNNNVVVVSAAPGGDSSPACSLSGFVRGGDASRSPVMRPRSQSLRQVASKSRKRKW